MIQIHKSLQAPPASLLLRHSYAGQDVQRQLLADQQDKCYLCERICITDYQVEHLRPCAKYPDLEFEWENLFLACSYCNQRKSSLYIDLPEPHRVPIAKLLKQKIDFTRKMLDVEPYDQAALGSLPSFLLRLFNGKRVLREGKEERFFEYCLSRVLAFQELCMKYLLKPNDVTRQAVSLELSEKSEFLGLKYWLICSYPELENAFSAEIAHLS